MNVLVIGSGGREHALCWKLAQGPAVSKLYCAPGNPGTAQLGTNVAIAAGSIDKLVEFARREDIALTMVGPEQPLCDGIVDRFVAEGLRVVGPTAKAAQLEGSKIFAKEFMERHRIPTAPFAVFDEAQPACDYVDSLDDVPVIKADGLAAGKGVFVESEAHLAKEAVRGLLDGGLGSAGRRVLVEQRLRGEEVSVIALCDGESVKVLASSQDHKAALEGDRGPNTGGMGAYSPAPVLTAALEQTVVQQVLERTVSGMAAEGNAYRGVLYAGLMIVGGQPIVLEFNCRFGDPETQPLMVRMSDDLLPLLEAVADSSLPAAPIAWDPQPALSVVMTAKGYPGSYLKGALIRGLEDASRIEGLEVFHAGTAERDGQLVTSGGRVLAVTARGETMQAAHDLAYRGVAAISWDGATFRRDIGHRALSRQSV